MKKYYVNYFCDLYNDDGTGPNQGDYILPGERLTIKEAVDGLFRRQKEQCVSGYFKIGFMIWIDNVHHILRLSYNPHLSGLYVSKKAYKNKMITSNNYGILPDNPSKKYSINAIVKHFHKKNFPTLQWSGKNATFKPSFEGFFIK